MLREFSAQHVNVELVLGCFEHPDAVLPEYKRESYWRKPNPGMVLEAIQKLRLNPSRSVFIGDQLRDLEAAAAGGVAHRLLLSDTLTPAAGMVRIASYAEAKVFLHKISTA